MAAPVGAGSWACVPDGAECGRWMRRVELLAVASPTCLLSIQPDRCRPARESRPPRCPHPWAEHRACCLASSDTARCPGPLATAVRPASSGGGRGEPGGWRAAHRFSRPRASIAPNVCPARRVPAAADAAQTGDCAIREAAPLRVALQPGGTASISPCHLCRDGRIGAAACATDGQGGRWTRPAGRRGVDWDRPVPRAAAPRRQDLAIALIDALEPRRGDRVVADFGVEIGEQDTPSLGQNTPAPMRLGGLTTQAAVQRPSLPPRTAWLPGPSWCSCRSAHRGNQRGRRRAGCDAGHGSAPLPGPVSDACGLPERLCASSQPPKPVRSQPGAPSGIGHKKSPHGWGLAQELVDPSRRPAAD